MLQSTLHTTGEETTGRRRTILRDVLPFLACPHCGAGLAGTGSGGGAVPCRNGHAFDVARHGYVNLRPGRAGAGTGDTAAMVAARERLLGSGHFDPLGDAVAGQAARALADGPPGCVVDVGAGTGWYLSRVLDRLGDRLGLALDVSRYALRRAARAHRRAGAAGCDIWQGLPVRDGVAALALNVFAPRNAGETARVLHPCGRLLVVTPTPRHLSELVGTLDLLSVDARKQRRLGSSLDAHFVRTGRTLHEHTMRLPRSDVLALVTMGPSGRHCDAAGLAERVDGLAEPVAVTVSAALSTYRPAV